MGNLVSSAIFSCRSGNQAVDGNAPRAITCVAQGVNAAEGYAKSGLAGSKAAGAFVSNIDKMAKEDSIWGKTFKGVKWAQTHVNPIIGACAGIKIAMADDKEKALCTEVPGFLGMLAAESGFKALQETKAVKTFMENITKSAGKHGKVAAALLEGVSFAAASIGGYTAASKIGECAIEGERAIKARKKLDAVG